uniref:Uncharacterized protein n=1 Tax=Brassica campestris TaxID=3711 RepID=M4DG32_BRACM
MEAVMEELHEVTRQYLSCPDPVEAAARRQRVLTGDANGQMEETARAIIKAAKDKQASADHNRFLECNPVTPPPANVPSLQETRRPDTSSLRTPPASVEGDLHSSPNGRKKDSTRARTPSPDNRGDTTRLKSIIVSPPLHAEGTNVTAQETGTVQEEEETLLEFQNKTRQKSTRQPRTRSPRHSPNILKGASSKKRRISQMLNSPSYKKRSTGGSSSKADPCHV